MKKGKDIKPHIGIFGRRNVGKSSFINALVEQEVAIVSNIAGTTTDPVKKSIEIFGIGPAIMVDTAGIDDLGELGEKRIHKTFEALKTVDCAILMINNKFGQEEDNLVLKFKQFNIPFIIVNNKSDLAEVADSLRSDLSKKYDKEVINFSATAGTNKEDLIKELKATIPSTLFVKPSLFKGLVKKNDVVLLITPIDSEAPEGRMILPQVMAIRDALDKHCILIVLRETDLEQYLAMIGSGAGTSSGFKPALVVTDSQVFGYVNSVLPQDIPLTSFSILFARIKGNFDAFIGGTPKLENLKDGDKVLILESCTHQVSCEDIGRYKVPNWIKEHTGKSFDYKVVSGLNEIKNLEEYKYVIQCGGCVSTAKQVQNRLLPAIEAGIPVTNYGMLIGYLNGIFNRCLAPILAAK